MFVRRTVFILGAGASYQFGYPLGNELPELVMAKADELRGYCKDHRDRLDCPKIIGHYKRSEDSKPWASWDRAAEHCLDLGARLKNAGPVVIDHFLQNNPKLHELGRTLVSWIICKKEEIAFSKQSIPGTLRPDTYKDNWVSLIVNQIIRDCEKPNRLFDNRVNFITFNYDLSLERLISRALLAREAITESVVREFLAEDRILHMYGALSLDYLSEPQMRFSFDSVGQEIDIAYEAGRNLLLIDPSTKIQNADRFEKAQKMIEEADRVYILGYGFDSTNNTRLGLPWSLSNLPRANQHKRIFFMNFDDMSVINDFISSTFLNGSKTIFEKDWDNPVLTAGGKFEFRKSKRKNVFSALTEDFGLTS